MFNVHREILVWRRGASRPRRRKPIELDLGYPVKRQTSSKSSIMKQTAIDSRILRQTLIYIITFFALVVNSVSQAYQDHQNQSEIINRSSSASNIGSPVYGNMSSMMMSSHPSGATPMTNASLTALVQSNTTAAAASSSSSAATTTMTNGKQNKTTSEGNNASAIKSAANGQANVSKATANNNHHHGNGLMVMARAVTTSSPAVITRLKQNNQQNRQQQHEHQQMAAGRRPPGDNQMAADDTQEMQNFMTINSVPTSVSDSMSTVPKGEAAIITRDKAEATSANSMATNRHTGSLDSSAKQSGAGAAASAAGSSGNKVGVSLLSAPNQSKSSARQQASGLWVASASTSQDPTSMGDQQQQQQLHQWRSRSIGASSKQIPSLATTTYSHQHATALDNPTQLSQQQRYLESSLLSPESPESLQQQQQQQPALQLEKPNGYSYETQAGSGGGYTHTSPLSPVRQGLMTAEQQVSTRQRQRQQHQQSVVGPQHYERTGHSSASLDWLASRSGASSSSPSGLGLAQSEPQFLASNANQHHQLPPIIQQQLDYSPTITGGYARQQATGAGRHPTPPGGHHPHQAFAMMPSPHLTITGTPANPCKPPLAGAGQHEPSSGISQVNLAIPASDIGQASSSAQALPNFSQSSQVSPKYQRVGDGTRLRSQYIFKVLRADSLTECELACAKASLVAGNNPQEACRSFNYRAYFAAENCELSRHDLRALKLEDGAQFELNTQFDFYALEPPAQAQVGGLSGALLASGSSAVATSISAAYSPFPEADCLDVSQSCTQDGMEFTLRTTEPFNGRIYTYGFYDSCFYDGEGSSANVLRISRSNGFPRCGTQQFGDLMTNIVVVQFNDYVQTTRDKKYNLTCYFSGPGEAVVTSNYLDTRIDERSQPMQIEHLPPQNVITSNVHLRVLYRGQPTNTIAVGDLLTFRLETRNSQLQHRANLEQAGGSGGQSEIFATNVLAKDPYSGRQVQLIDSRGCPIDPVNVFPELQRTPDGALESEFYAFKIPDSNFLIFQATVRTCKAPCEPVICHSSTGTQLAGLDQAQRGQYMVSAGGGGLGTKGGYLMQSPASGHLAYLAPQRSSVPSWGKRRRRRRRRDALDGGDEGDFGIGVGESVEHVIPVRFAGSSGSSLDPRAEIIHQTPREVKTFRRPELSEAEEEVKEMFRVYMSRAEIDKQRHHHQNVDRALLHQSDTTRQDLLGDSGVASADVSSSHHQSSPLIDNAAKFQEQTDTVGDQICLNQSSYYVILFTVISLSLVMFSVLFVSLYITRKAKFHISDSIANSIF